jgi:hypothetical protein
LQSEKGQERTACVCTATTTRKPIKEVSTTGITVCFVYMYTSHYCIAVVAAVVAVVVQFPLRLRSALTYRLQTLHHSFQDTLTGSHLALARTTSWYTCFEVLVGALSLSHINLTVGQRLPQRSVFSYTDLLAVMCWQFQGLDYSH